MPKVNVEETGSGEEESTAWKASDARELKAAVKQGKANKGQIGTINQRLSAIDKKLQFLNKNAVTRMLKEARADATELHNRMRMLTLRLTVVTEVSAVLCQLHPNIADKLRCAIIRMIDDSDEWWQAREGFTLSEWRQAALLYESKARDAVRGFGELVGG